MGHVLHPLLVMLMNSEREAGFTVQECGRIILIA